MEEVEYSAEDWAIAREEARERLELMEWRRERKERSKTNKPWDEIKWQKSK